MAAILVAASAAGSGSCGGPAAPPALGSQRKLPAWTGRAAQAFDDVMEPAALGLEMATTSPRQNPLLRERAQTAEFVGRVRISTVTVEPGGGEQPVYRVGFSQLGEPFRGRLPGDRLDVMVSPTGLSFGIVKNFDTRLVGRTFIGFFQAFAGAAGPDVHWHLSPDTQEVAGAVREGALLGEAYGR